MTVSEEWAELSSTVAAAGLNLRMLPPATEAEILRCEASTTRWPDQLRGFYAVHNGQNAGVDRDLGELLPATEWFSLDFLTREYERLSSEGQSEIESDPWLRELNTGSEAGVPAHVFLPSYVPLCGLDSYYYFCDTRPGEYSGCIRWWTRDNGDNGQLPIWLSVSDMLRAIRLSISENSPLLGLWWPCRDEESDALTWTTRAP